MIDGGLHQQRHRTEPDLQFASGHPRHEDGRLYTDGAILPTAKGNSVMTMRGKTTQSTGEARIQLSWKLEDVK
jgi:hypothetical protein